MAYLSEISLTCEYQGYCNKKATHRVYAYANELHGQYCKKHAQERVESLTKAEAGNPAGFKRP